MGLNWVEDIVARLYGLKGYMVIQNEDLVMPKTPSRSIRGHSDIDIIAIKDDAIVHVECQSWWGPALADEKKQFERLHDRFENAPYVIFKKYRFLKCRRPSRVFVTSGKPKKSTGHGPWDRLADFCSERDIELVEINTIIRELVLVLRERYPCPQRIGKEPTLSRFLLHLIHAGFIDHEAIESKDNRDTGRSA